MLAESFRLRCHRDVICWTVVSPRCRVVAIISSSLLLYCSLLFVVVFVLVRWNKIKSKKTRIRKNVTQAYLSVAGNWKRVRFVWPKLAKRNSLDIEWYLDFDYLRHDNEHSFCVLSFWVLRYRGALLFILPAVIVFEVCVLLLHSLWKGLREKLPRW